MGCWASAHQEIGEARLGHRLAVEDELARLHLHRVAGQADHRLTQSSGVAGQRNTTTSPALRVLGEIRPSKPPRPNGIEKREKP
jgi:hypothetical protein